MIQADLPS